MKAIFETYSKHLDLQTYKAPITNVTILKWFVLQLVYSGPRGQKSENCVSIYGVIVAKATELIA